MRYSKKVSPIKDTVRHGSQLCKDSKHSLFLNNFPIIEVGYLDIFEQFNLTALSFSKEDEKAFFRYFHINKRGYMEVEADQENQQPRPQQKEITVKILQSTSLIRSFISSLWCSGRVIIKESRDCSY